MKKIWVIKVGSQVLCDRLPGQIDSWMQQVLKLKLNHKIDLIWVSSGAIASGKEELLSLGYTKYSFKKIHEKQSLSAIGQPLLMDIYRQALKKYRLPSAQILLSYKDLQQKKSRTHFLNTIQQLLSWGVLPILNQNDAVATEEIQFGDNDQLAALVACHVKAKKLIIVSDVKGLYEKDPKNDSTSKPISKLKKLNPIFLKELKSSSRSVVGTGGIYSKVLAAKKVNKSKIPCHIVSGKEKNVFIDILLKKSSGTEITLYEKA